MAAGRPFRGLVHLEAQVGRERAMLAAPEGGPVGWDEVKFSTRWTRSGGRDERRVYVDKVENARESVKVMTADASAQRERLEGLVAKKR